MNKLAHGILGLTVLSISVVLAFAFFIQEKQDTNKTLSANDRKEAISLMKRSGVPAKYAPLYYDSAERGGVDWRLLASIGYAETDHGRSPLPGVWQGINSAACCAGMMQICVVDDCGNVWREYARDGNGNKKKSPYEAGDSILAAAYYLRWMRDYLGNDPRRLAAGYNAGPTIVYNEGIPDYPETREYIKKIKKIYNSLQKDSWRKIT